MDEIEYRTLATEDVHIIEAHYQHFAFSRHYHLDFHIGLIIQGEQRFFSHGSHWQVGAGDVVIMPPDILHDGQSVGEQGYQVKVLAIAPATLGDLLDQKESDLNGMGSPSIVRDPQIFRALFHFHRDAQQNALLPLAHDALLLDTLTPLFAPEADFDKASRTPLTPRELQTLKTFVLEHLHRPLRLDDLALHCQLSLSQFQRRFRASVGLSPYAWVSRLRLERAMQLLRSGLPAISVAHQVGYFDQAHFSKAFKHSFGISPSDVIR